MGNKTPLIHLICDYGSGDLAFIEVINHLKHLLPSTEILPLSAPSFSTLNTGFLIAQLALYGKNKNIFIYSNTAPRTDKKTKRPDNAGEKFKLATLDNGVEIASIDAGFCFSFIKSHIKTLKNIKVKNQGSQFRSRDFYPPAVAGLIKGQKQKYLGATISTKHIPAIPKNQIMHIDGYGNIKTTIRHSEVRFKPGQKLTITINGQTHQATYVDGSFNINPGEIAFSPGSSGGKDQFMEVFLRGFNTAERFNYPKVEHKIKISLS